jgi:predicted Rossmann fold nucleotide-binding protein DprA/Smf involved in DNA uptake
MAQPATFPQGSAAYPERLLDRLGSDAPKAIAVLGDPHRLQLPMTAFFCSKDTPGATILQAFDQAAAWRDANRCIASGFHSPLERQCLEILLRGNQPIIMAVARGLNSIRLSKPARQALHNGRLTIISPFSLSERRANAEFARQRNRCVAALADEVVFAFVAASGSLARLDGEVTRWGICSRHLFRP